MSLSHLFKSAGLVVVLGAATLVIPGCGETSVDQSAAEKPAAVAALSDEQVDSSWVVTLATNEALGPFLGNPGWATYVMKRDYKGSVKQFAGHGGQPLARVHEDVASLYRQAALLSANAIVQTYGKAGVPEDPLGTAHLLAVSYALLGDLEAAKAESAKMESATDDPTFVWHAPWREWFAAGAQWPPDLSTLPIEIMEPTPGQWPGAGSLPHYQLPERTEDARLRDMGDPGVLVRLAMWHSAAARLAAPDQVAILDSYSVRYRWPVEGMEGGEAVLPIEYLFGSDFSFGGDAGFLNAALGGKGAADVAKWSADGSGLAAMVLASTKGGAMDAEAFTDIASNYRSQLLDRATVKTEGAMLPFHRTFAGMARIGSLRVGAEYAESLGDRESSGKLRILAMDAEGSMETTNKDYTSSPIGMLSLAAWDAGNGYPTRGLDIINKLAHRYESLETARFALDVLALRVSRSSVGESAGM